jgi:cardiolipin synthase
MILKQLPNLVSLLRLFLIVPFLYCLQSHAYPAAFYLFLFAGITDSIDGWLARQFHCQTYLGRFIDPLADKLLITCSVVSLAMLHQLPWWLVLLIFSRDLTISVGVVVWYYCIEQSFNFTPTKLSKMNTALQIILVGFCLINIAFFQLPNALISTCIFFTATTTTVTFLDYVWTWGQKVCSPIHP